jgi:hypothetical protein
MIDFVAHDATQFAAKAGPVAIAKINMTAIERIYRSIGKLYHSIILSTRCSLG